MNDPYTMVPLSQDTSTPQFRLVELHPRKSSSLITCTLRIYSLNDQYPAYRALSYTWGSSDNPCRISLNGTEFYVRRNLWTFLEQMCLQGQYGVYWIDAICIDQTNVLEKNHQVQVMRCIYSGAVRVVVWLGEANHVEMSDIAMDLLASSSPRVRVDQYIPPDSWNRPQRLAVESIFRRDYWTRIWIVQETMIAKEISVYCGSKKLEWQVLTEFVFFLATTPSKDQPEFWMLAQSLLATMAMRLVYDREEKRTTQRQRTITELLIYYNSSQASNMLDKVYALCGLASDGDNILINYGISPTDLVAHLLDRASYSWPGNNPHFLEWTACNALGLDWTEDSFNVLFDSQ